MRERPILFNGAMVRAIREGRKTQTRRVSGLEVINSDPDRYELLGIASGPGEPHYAFRDKQSGAQTLVRCGSGQPGDRLWAREHWACDDQFNRTPPREVPPAYAVRYLADETVRPGLGHADGKDRRAFHMPRWASRILLEIVRVRLERLKDISEADAIAEGVFKKVGSCPIGDEVETATGGLLIYALPDQARAEFKLLWESINGADAWTRNPWVWVLQLARLHSPTTTNQSTGGLTWET